MGTVLVIVSAVVVAATSGWAAAAVVLVLGLGLAVLLSPALWTRQGDRTPPEQPGNELRF